MGCDIPSVPSGGANGSRAGRGSYCTLDEQGFPDWLAVGTILQGWALATQGQREETIAQIHQGMASLRATGAEFGWTYWLALLAEAHGKAGLAKKGLSTLAEALAVVNKTGERFYEAELYRLKGTLTLQSKTGLGQVSDKSRTSLGQVSGKSRRVRSHQPPAPNP
jgi:predicted ATPase